MTDKIQESGLSPTITVKLDSGGTSIQPLDDVSLLTNDVGYLTAGDLPSSVVLSVDGRTGAITLGDLYEGVIGAKGSAFNKNFGTIANSVAEGNDLRLSDARTPLSHNHTKSQITDFSDGDYATAAQGALADSALQNGANNSLLTNDAGYITLGEVPDDAPVDSVDGRIGVVTLGDLYATFAQGALADSSVQNGDNISALVNDLAYIAEDDTIDNGTY